MHAAQGCRYLPHLCSARMLKPAFQESGAIMNWILGFGYLARIEAQSARPILILLKLYQSDVISLLFRIIAPNKDENPSKIGDMHFYGAKCPYIFLHQFKAF
jgi:hypothetical protein